jgi:hypothetical protein
MRLATWNLEHASVGKNPRRLELLLSAAADIWVLTEGSPGLFLARGIHERASPLSEHDERSCCG